MQKFFENPYKQLSRRRSWAPADRSFSSADCNFSLVTLFHAFFLLTRGVLLSHQCGAVTPSGDALPRPSRTLGGSICSRNAVVARRGGISTHDAAVPWGTVGGLASLSSSDWQALAMTSLPISMSGSLGPCVDEGHEKLKMLFLVVSVIGKRERIKKYFPYPIDLYPPFNLWSLDVL